MTLLLDKRMSNKIIKNTKKIPLLLAPPMQTGKNKVCMDL